MGSTELNETQKLFGWGKRLFFEEKSLKFVTFETKIDVSFCRLLQIATLSLRKISNMLLFGVSMMALLKVYIKLVSRLQTPSYKT
jgi:hypothetical protein